MTTGSLSWRISLRPLSRSALRKTSFDRNCRVSQIWRDDITVLATSPTLTYRWVRSSASSSTETREVSNASWSQSWRVGPACWTERTQSCSTLRGSRQACISCPNSTPMCPSVRKAPHDSTIKWLRRDPMTVSSITPFQSRNNLDTKRGLRPSSSACTSQVWSRWLWLILIMVNSLWSNGSCLRTLLSCHRSMVSLAKLTLRWSTSKRLKFQGSLSKQGSKLPCLEHWWLKTTFGKLNNRAALNTCQWKSPRATSSRKAICCRPQAWDQTLKRAQPDSHTRR